MPVILRNRAEIDIWLEAPWAEAKKLQRPLPDSDLVLLPLEEQKPKTENALPIVRAENKPDVDESDQPSLF